jgi:hypothetical protein
MAELTTISLEDYSNIWADTQDLSPSELEELGQTNVQLSADLTEATYNIPYEVLDINLDACDEVMNDFVPWRTFHKLFRSHERVVDMTELIKSGYWQGPAEVTSSRGSFMGDGMSFIHLSFLLSGVVRSVCIDTGQPRPLGQSVGDDLVLLETKLPLCLAFCKLAEELGCTFSKLNSVSEDTATFCENYVAKVSDLTTFKQLKPFENSIFGEFMYLDVIKGSLMSGRSKVKADGKSPFLGHAHMLNKQVRWNPLVTTQERSKTFLWASNFMEARRLGSAMASLPQQLGGADLAIGTILEFDDVKFYKTMLPYYERMLTLERGEFLKYYLLLTGIYKSNPKGFVWENDWKVIREVIDNSTIQVISNLNTVVPEELHGSDPLAKLRYINDELRLISIRNLSDELCRRDAYLKMWNGKVAKTFMTLKISNVRQRVNHAWAIIKSNLQPVPEEEYTSTSMSHLVHKFQEISWGLYVSKDDPAIANAFQGTPSMFMDLSTLLLKEYEDMSESDMSESSD